MFISSLEESAAELLSSLLSMGEERSSEFHLPGADDGEIISEVLHLLREHFAPFGQILVVAPRVLDFSYEIVEHVRRMRPALLV